MNRYLLPAMAATTLFALMAACGLGLDTNSKLLSSPAASPVPLPFGTLAAGVNMACALANGNSYCWGDQAVGMLGNNVNSGTPSNSAFAVFAGQQGGLGTGANLSQVQMISAGNSHACAVISDGTLYCWGDNTNGDLGDGTSVQRLTPIQVLGGAQTGATLKTVSTVSAGYNFTCAIADTAQHIYCWGYGVNGQLGNGTIVSSTTPVQVVAGSQNVGAPTLPFLGATTVAVATYHACALAGGFVYCWGLNGGSTDYPLGDGNAGTVQTTTPLQVVAGQQSGSTYLSGITAISTGSGAYHSCALDSTGHVYCWGNNCNGQIGNGNTIGGSPCGVLTPAEVLAGQQTGTGGDTHLSSIRAIAVANDHSCALATSGNVFCWGDNVAGATNYGDLGDGTTLVRNTPIEVLAGAQSGVGTYLSNVIEISAGWSQTCALTSTGAVFCWGNPTSTGVLTPAGAGALGDGSTSAFSSPIQVVTGAQGNSSGFLISSPLQ